MNDFKERITTLTYDWHCANSDCFLNGVWHSSVQRRCVCGVDHVETLQSAALSEGPERGPAGIASSIIRASTMRLDDPAYHRIQVRANIIRARQLLHSQYGLQPNGRHPFTNVPLPIVCPQEPFYYADEFNASIQMVRAMVDAANNPNLPNAATIQPPAPAAPEIQQQNMNTNVEHVTINATETRPQPTQQTETQHQTRVRGNHRRLRGRRGQAYRGGAKHG